MKTPKPVPTRAHAKKATISAGDGWGGPAKGAGKTDPIAPASKLTPGCSREKRALTLTKREIREARVAALEDRLFHLALKAEREETQVSAAARLHAIYEGQPMARQLTLQVDDVSQLSDHEIRAELARIGRSVFEAGEGTSPPSLPRRPPDVVH